MPTTPEIKKAQLLLHPCKGLPLGKGFGVWGPRWQYHFDDSGKWVKGQVRRPSGMCGQHGGQDILAPHGTAQVAPGAGIVLEAGWQNPKDHLVGYGLRLILQLDGTGGLLLTGGHFSELMVKKGDVVERGQLIGLSGDTGNAFGPHAHWQLELPGPYPRQPIPFEFVGA
jgi:murein DD-endopeptidase MepM/ murein hydrolase activator NlpD